MRFVIRFGCGLLLLGLAAACNEDPDVAEPRTVADVVAEDPQFSMLQTALAYSRFSDALRATNLTLFAPTNTAFQAAGYPDPSAILALPPETVRALLRYHVLTDVVRAEAVPASQRPVLTGLDSTLAYVSSDNGTVRINSSRVTQPDVVAANGVVHVVDRTLSLPQPSLLTAIRSNPNLTLFDRAIRRAATAPSAQFQQLLNRLNATQSTGDALTVLAPTNAAFRAAGYPDEAAINAVPPLTLINLLNNHVLPNLVLTHQFRTGTVLTSVLAGGRISVLVNVGVITLRGNRNFIPAAIDGQQRDIVTPNGALHVIDQVLLP